MKRLMSRYAEASFGSKNRSHRGESIRVISLYNETKNQYRINPDLLEEAITRAENKLESSENGLISADLGPFNTMPKGAIDFEFLHTGPIGYDVYTAPIIGFYFPEAAKSYRQKMYDFSDKQLSDYYHNMEIIAHKHQHGSLLRYWNEFILLKTIWAAAKPKDYRGEAFSDPEREYFWSVFRFNILQHVIDHYLKGGELLPQKFPEIGVSGKW